MSCLAVFAWADSLSQLAGHETTAQAVTFALYLLAKHPNWQVKARAEARAVLGSSGSSNPSREAAASLPLIGCIIYETLRLFPAVPNISRIAGRDVTLEPAPHTPHHQTEAQSPPRPCALAPGAKLRVQAGTSVVIPIVMLHRDRVGPLPRLFFAACTHPLLPAPVPLQRYWSGDPEAFDPDRFKNGIAGACSHPLAFLPFSHGPRNCVGAQFALLEARLILAAALLRVEWRLSPTYCHRPVAAITLRPEHGLQLLVRPA